MFQDTITVSALPAHRRMKPAEPSASADNRPPSVDVPDYRPVEHFWPYLQLPEQPTDEELARLDPSLAEALFGTSRRPFSVSLEFSAFDGPAFDRALAMARESAEYIGIGGVSPRYRARFHPQDALELRNLFDLVGRFDSTEVLIDDRPVPYARELWLPLVWFLIR